jgi:hypothetical protein
MEIFSSIPISGPQSPFLFNILGTFAGNLTLTINSMEITYTPISLNDVGVTIAIPIGGMTVTGSIIGSGSNTTAQTITGIVLTFPDANRVISNSFDQNGPIATNTTNNAVITTGDTSVPIGPVPSVTPVDVTIEPFCIHPDSKVHTNRGLKRLGDIRTEDKICVYDHEENLIGVEHNAEFVGSEKFVKFDIGSLGMNQPDHPLYVTEGHPILFNGKEHIAKSLINGKGIYLVTEPVDKTYCLVTKKRTFIMINNVKVCTWCLDDLQKIAKEKGLYYKIV